MFRESLILAWILAILQENLMLAWRKLDFDSGGTI